MRLIFCIHLWSQGQPPISSCTVPWVSGFETTKKGSWMKESSQHHHNVTHPHDCHAVRIHVCSFSVELTPRTDDVIAFLFLTVTCLGLLKSAEHALHCRQLSPQKGAHQSSLQKHVNDIDVKINCYTADWRGELHNGCSLHGQHTGPPTTRWEIAPLQHIWERCCVEWFELPTALCQLQQWLCDIPRMVALCYCVHKAAGTNNWRVNPWALKREVQVVPLAVGQDEISWSQWASG